MANWSGSVCDFMFLKLCLCCLSDWEKCNGHLISAEWQCVCVCVCGLEVGGKKDCWQHNDEMIMHVLVFWGTTGTLGTAVSCSYPYHPSGLTDWAATRCSHRPANLNTHLTHGEVAGDWKMAIIVWEIAWCQIQIRVDGFYMCFRA